MSQGADSNLSYYLLLNSTHFPTEKAFFSPFQAAIMLFDEACGHARICALSCQIRSSPFYIWRLIYLVFTCGFSFPGSLTKPGTLEYKRNNCHSKGVHKHQTECIHKTINALLSVLVRPKYERVHELSFIELVQVQHCFSHRHTLHLLPGLKHSQASWVVNIWLPLCLLWFVFHRNGKTTFICLY